MKNDIKNEIQPIIFGGDISAYSLAREFHEAYGVKSIALTTSKGAVNQYTNILETIVDERFLNPDFVVETIKDIKAKNPEKTLIAQGCRDWQVRMLIENKERIQAYCVVPYIDEALLNSIVRKNDFYNLCDKYSIDHPKTIIYDFFDPIDLSDPGVLDLTFPLIAKPADSVEYYNVSFEGQKKVFKLETEDELKDLLEKAAASGYKGKFIIQDFIPGDDSNMRVLTCYCDKNSKVVFAALGRTLMEDQGENAIGNPVAIINEAIDENTPVLKQAKMFLESIGYTGFGNFDIKYDSRDDKFKFFEINTRLGASSLYILAGGTNPVEYLVDEYIYGKEFSEFKTTPDIGLYTKVHRSNIETYLEDKTLLKKVDILYSIKKNLEPLNYKKDTNSMHKLYSIIFMKRQKKRFDEYLNKKRWNEI